MASSSSSHSHRNCFFGISLTYFHMSNLQTWLFLRVNHPFQSHPKLIHCLAIYIITYIYILWYSHCHYIHHITYQNHIKPHLTTLNHIRLPCFFCDHSVASHFPAAHWCHFGALVPDLLPVISSCRLLASQYFKYAWLGASWLRCVGLSWIIYIVTVIAIVVVIRYSYSYKLSL